MAFIWVVFSAFHVDFYYHLFCDGKRPQTGGAYDHDIFGEGGADYEFADKGL